MRGLILAAGRGSRCKELTDYGTKALIEFQGQRLLDWQTQALQAAGVDELGIVTGYKAEKIVDFAGKAFHNANWQHSNMVASLLCARDWIDQDCIISYSDIIYSPDVISTLKASSDDISIVYDPKWLDIWSRRFEDPLMDAEVFKIDQHNRLQVIGMKPQTLHEVQGQFMGLLKVTPRGWEKITNYLSNLSSETIQTMDTTKLLNGLLEEGQSIQCLPISDRWYEIDSQSDIEVYDQIIAAADSIFHW